MYKVTNIFTEERGFETDGKMFVLKPKESVIVKKAPEAVEGILKVEKTTEKPGSEEKMDKSKIEEKPKQEVKK